MLNIWHNWETERLSRNIILHSPKVPTRLKPSRQYYPRLVFPRNQVGYWQLTYALYLKAAKKVLGKLHKVEIRPHQLRKHSSLFAVSSSGQSVRPIWRDPSLQGYRYFDQKKKLNLKCLNSHCYFRWLTWIKKAHVISKIPFHIIRKSPRGPFSRIPKFIVWKTPIIEYCLYNDFTLLRYIRVPLFLII